MVMFLLYHLGTYLEDVLIVGLHIDKVRLYCLLGPASISFKQWQKKLFTITKLTLAVLSVDFFICIGKTIHILL